MERLPDNLAALYESFGVDAIDSIGTGDEFEVDGVEFVCGYRPESTAQRFYIVKTPDLIERYRELCERFHGGTFFELGIAEGGSTALLALWAQPARLVAVDLERSPLAALDEFVVQRGLTDVVLPRYGVDQSDRARLQELVAADLGGGRPVDVVVDDCSHDLGLTRTSFDALFPLVRAGGWYVIEDWRNDIVYQSAMVAALGDPTSPAHAEFAARVREVLQGDRPAPPRRAPLARLALELAIARADSDGVIHRVIVDEHWIIVERGPAEVDAGTFQLDDLYVDRFELLGPLP